MKAKILVVDDEKTARISLRDILRLEGYAVEAVDSGPAALDQIEQDHFDLMLLDIKMPGMDGIEVLRKVVEISPHTLVILLTAHGSLESAIEALRFGAHDYLIKPSSPPEILSSVAAGLARQAESQHKRMLLDQLESSIRQLKTAEGIAQSAATGHRLVSLPGEVMVDLSRREIWRGSELIRLTPTEGKLLQILLEYKGRVMSHQELVFLVQGYDIQDWEAPEVLRPLVSRLRRKLSVFPGGGDWIVNVRGTGYVFEIDEGG
ncbi:MAG: response regulator transcription factor [Anaerolineales bacterium]|nr:response regulator transcription factor [Anaerolineales bacterium]